jgi:hypothetical protein
MSAGLSGFATPAPARDQRGRWQPTAAPARGDATWNTWFNCNFSDNACTTIGARALESAEELMTTMGFARPQDAVGLHFGDVFREHASQINNDLPLLLVLKAACTMDKFLYARLPMKRATSSGAPPKRRRIIGHAKILPDGHAVPRARGQANIFSPDGYAGFIAWLYTHKQDQRSAALGIACYVTGASVSIMSQDMRIANIKGKPHIVAKNGKGPWRIPAREAEHLKELYTWYDLEGQCNNATDDITPRQFQARFGELLREYTGSHKHKDVYLIGSHGEHNLTFFVRTFIRSRATHLNCHGFDSKQLGHVLYGGHTPAKRELGSVIEPGVPPMDWNKGFVHVLHAMGAPIQPGANRMCRA